MNDSAINERIDQLVTTTLATLQSRRRTPLCTYRVQLRGDSFTFRDAAAVIPYLHELGISHLYCSPYLKARPGSTHGYDIVDHSRLNPELGTEDDYRTLIEALRNAEMGNILDIVPNHMGIAGDENAWWQDVLENGPGSPYASYFDIDWRPAKQELHNKILLPFLGDQYGQVLEAGHLQLELEDGTFRLRCYDWRLPVEPKSYAMILSRCLDAGTTEFGADAEPLQELASIVWACENLPDITETVADRVLERQREKEIIKSRLQRLLDNEPAVNRLIRAEVAEFNGDPADPESFNALDELLDHQVYRLSHWKAASDEINYRRFFDINELAALCVEDQEVFEATHEFVLQLLVRGDIDGLRIDHVDGLLHPAEYLRRLQRGYVCRLGQQLFEADEPAQKSSAVAEGQPLMTWTDSGSGSSALQQVSLIDETTCLAEWYALEPLFLQRLEERTAEMPALAELSAHLNRASEKTPHHATSGGPAALPLYVIVEKILEDEETLPADWPVAGTTGYGFLNRTTELFIDGAGYRKVTQAYRRFSGVKAEYDELVSASKRLILRVAMAAELQLLAARLNRLSERHRRTRDFTLNSLRDVLREILACFPVYRTYITPHAVSPRDRQFVHLAIRRAQRNNPALDDGLFHFVRRSLLFESPLLLDERSELDQEMFVGRFQQASSPVMAKGTEDTAFYQFFPLCSLNEVGGSPKPQELSVSRFHNDNIRRRETRPASLSATTTHDSKRSEDTRARISVLSQLPDQWRQAVSRWARMNRRHVQHLESGPAPGRNDEYLFYQTLIGIWPTEPPDQQERNRLIARMQQYMGKAAHEAKLRTSWVNPVAEYDEAIRSFVQAVLTSDRRNRFLPDFQQFCDGVLDAGLYTALSQVFLKLTAPGVPDIFQGQELWDFSLVDPDNRRPVDYQQRQQLLEDVKRHYGNASETHTEFVRHLGCTPRDPRLKLFVTWRTLQFRRRSQILFEDGEYVPLEVDGPRAEQVCAFAWRRRPGEPSAIPTLAIAIAPRLIAAIRSTGNESAIRAPLGPDVWDQTRVSLAGVESDDLVDVFRGVRCSSGANQLDLSEVLAEFPLALLSNRPQSPER